MKTKKLYNEQPLPKGLPKPPEGLINIGSDPGASVVKVKGSACYFKDEHRWQYNGKDDFWWYGGGNSHPIAAPAAQVRRLSTQRRAERAKRAKEKAKPEPRKPYDEKPLPDGIPVPPDGFCYVGKGDRNREIARELVGLKRGNEWDNDSRGWSGMDADVHYAAPAELCNRLPEAPKSDAGHCIVASEPTSQMASSPLWPLFVHMEQEFGKTLTEAELADIVFLCEKITRSESAKQPRYRVHVESKGAPVVWHKDITKAYAEAERLANLLETMGKVYIYQVVAELTVEKVVRKGEV